MSIEIRKYTDRDLPQMISIWNQIVESGDAFPQLDLLDEESASVFFGEQTAACVAVEGDIVAGLYILHPNNVGRCSHVGNASYGISYTHRNKGIGRKLVEHSLQTAKQEGFRGMQFNAVLVTNLNAIHLYEKLGFIKVGVIPGGYREKEENYVDMIIFYKDLIL